MAKQIGRKKLSIVMLILLIVMIFAIVSVALVSWKTQAYAANAESVDIPFPYDQNYFDEYTSSDLILFGKTQYTLQTISSYRALYADGLALASDLPQRTLELAVSYDDPVVGFVPRELLERRGTYLHIGEQYGFYVNTEQLVNDENVSVVFVFDITKYPLNNSGYPSQYVIEIRPTFQFTYYYLTESSNFDTGDDSLVYKVDSSLSTVVVAVPKLHYNNDMEVFGYSFKETQTYFLKDISFGLLLANEQELNIGDDGYDKYSDNGSFITRANLNFSGVGNQSLIGDTVVSTVKFGLGFVPYVGEALSVIEFLSDIVSNASNDFRDNLEYGDLYNEQYYNSKTEQLEHYSNLNKSAYATLSSSDSKPLLFGRTKDDNYVRAVFTLGMTDDWLTRAMDYIQLSVVSETTHLNGNSTITSRTTAERSTRHSVRNLQAKELLLESTQDFVFLSEGITRYTFNAEYSSKYTLTIPHADQMLIAIDNEEAVFSNDKCTLQFASGKHNIVIFGRNPRKLTTSITIVPNTISGGASRNSLTIDGNEQYLLKITSLSQLKQLSTGDKDIVIQHIFTNKWSDYLNYGSISPTSSLTHPFIFGNYYVIIQNNKPQSVTINFALAEPTVLTQQSSLKVDSNADNYTYVKFTANATDSYLLTASNMDGLSVIVLNNDSMLTNAGGQYYPGLYFELSISAGKTVYIGIKNNQTTTNTLTIKPSNTAIQWQITGSKVDVVAPESSYLATRNATYTFAIIINGKAYDNVVFSYKNQATAYGNYSISNPANNKLKLNSDCPVGGNGIIVSATLKNNNSSISVNSIYIVPQMETSFTKIVTGLINSDDMQFTYSVPKYVNKIDYTIYPGGKVFTQSLTGQTGTVSFKNNYNSLKETTPKTIYIYVTKIYYLDAFQNEHNSDVYITSNLSMNSMFADGSGTSSSPYGITCRRHFENIFKASGKYYSLKNNLTLSDWSQFNEFKGTLNGNNYTVTMTVYTDATCDIGLFSVNSGTIKNLNLKAKIKITLAYTEWQNIGGFVGLNNGTLENCNLESYIGKGKDVHDYDEQEKVHSYITDIHVYHRESVRIGGIAGYNKGRIINCNNNGASIYGRGDIGGIAGWSEGNGTTTGYIYNCDNDGRIHYLWKSKNKSIGGVVGYQPSGLISKCYNYATISYDNLKRENADIKPKMGRIVGHKCGTVEGYNSSGKVDTGSLFKHNGFLGIGSYNQLEYAGDRAFGKDAS